MLHKLHYDSTLCFDGINLLLIMFTFFIVFFFYFLPIQSNSIYLFIYLFGKYHLFTFKALNLKNFDLHSFFF